ncbi:hypothetical protein GCM10011391_13850 [Pullulanibacillus camelliae]|uniref:N-acetyltransferase domain-containing protein n=1 Tax=Pullulanibacillus camelliae TaxID=1707096 RepID=A0A8J2VNU4_9BACL|nr:UDP-4-amino-4,6-dideoxy-N-acetyl-beta-L-altrosamine N-acetyltransferase [Pullulanibacillus camelliae]GGE36268.1 hypothetical protein GCM10011391_13850 [Pullulanibacillus camelliae]
MICYLKPIEEKYLTTILEWRNSLRIRRAMFTEDIISMDEHKKWFETVNLKSDFSIFLFFCDQMPLGVMSFNQTSYVNAFTFWGFYIGTQSSKGFGKILGYLGLEYAFNQLKLNKVYGEVLTGNEKSIKFHESFGFNQEGYFKNHINKQGEFCDVIRYALFNEEWRHKRKDFLELFTSKGIQIHSSFEI